MYITPAQRNAFFRAMSAACQNLGLDTQDDRELYRKQVMREECQKEHLAQLSRTTDFDRCMARFANDAGDWQTAIKFASGDAYRMAVIIKICCYQIMQLKGVPSGSDAANQYLAAILERSRIACGTYANDASFWMDVSKDSLLTVFQILDTHRRRLLSAYPSLDGMKSFEADIVYTPRPGGITVRWDKAYYASLTAIKVNVQAA